MVYYVTDCNAGDTMEQNTRGDKHLGVGTACPRATCEGQLTQSNEGGG